MSDGQPLTVAQYCFLAARLIGDLLAREGRVLYWEDHLIARWVCLLKSFLFLSRSRLCPLKVNQLDHNFGNVSRWTRFGLALMAI